MHTPLSGIDHLTLGVANLEDAAADYALLLECAPESERTTGIHFRLPNLELRLEQRPSVGLAGLCFASEDLARFERRAARLNLLGAVGDSQAALALDPANCRGMPLAVTQTQRCDTAVWSGNCCPGLDHLVIRSSDPEATAALYGARLGLDMRLDLSRPDWGARLMFFRCGDLIVEIYAPLENTITSGQDSFFGLSWRVRNAEASRARLAEAGFDVSEVRDGRKPGTRVLTVRNRTAGVPTLLVQPA